MYRFSSFHAYKAVSLLDFPKSALTQLIPFICVLFFELD